MFDKNELPLTLKPQHIREILDMGERQVYELLNNDPPFRVVKLGRNYKIPRDKFFEWFEGTNKQG